MMITRIKSNYSEAILRAGITELDEQSNKATVTRPGISAPKDPALVSEMISTP